MLSQESPCLHDSQPFSPLQRNRPSSPLQGGATPALLLSHVPGRCLVRTWDQIESEVFVDLTHQVLKPEDCPVVLMTFLENKRSKYYWAELIRHSTLPFVCRAFEEQAATQPSLNHQRQGPGSSAQRGCFSHRQVWSSSHRLLPLWFPKATQFLLPPGSWENVPKGCLW